MIGFFPNRITVHLMLIERVLNKHNLFTMSNAIFAVSPPPPPFSFYFSFSFQITGEWWFDAIYSPFVKPIVWLVLIQFIAIDFFRLSTPSTAYRDYTLSIRKFNLLNVEWSMFTDCNLKATINNIDWISFSKIQTQFRFSEKCVDKKRE